MNRNLCMGLVLFCLALALSSCKSTKNTVAENNTTQTPEVLTRTTSSQKGAVNQDMTMISEKLDLSKTQIKKLEDIESKYGKEMQALKSKGMNAEDKNMVMAEIKAMKEKQNAEIASVLGKEKYNQYVEMKMAGKGGGKPMKPKTRGTPGKGKGMADKTPEELAAMRENRSNQKMIKVLELSKDQTTKYLDVQTKYKDLLMAANGSEEEIAKLNAAKSLEMKDILSETQFVQYESLMAKQMKREANIAKQNMPDKRGKLMEGGTIRRPGGEAMLGKISSELGLDEAKKEQLFAIDKKYRDLMQKSSGTREVLKAQMDALKEQKLGEIKAMLTPEQFTKYVDLTSQMRGRGRG